MLKFLVITLLFFNIGFINGGEIEISNIYDVVDSVLRDLMHGDLTFGGNIGDIDKTTWTKTLKVLVPDITGAERGLSNLAKSLNVFIDALLEENKTKNPKNVYVPTKILLENKKAVDDMNAAFNNIVNTKLVVTIQNNEKTLKTKDGNVIIPAELAHLFTALVTNIANQFNDLKTATSNFQKALYDLAKALSVYDKSAFGPFLFKRCSEGAKKAAALFGLISNDLTDLIQQYYNIAHPQPNGEVLFDTNSLNGATNDATQRIAQNMDRIAASVQMILNKISASASY